MSSDSDTKLYNLADEKRVELLREWLSVTNDDGQTTNIRWGKLALLSLGSWLLSGVVGIAEVLGGLGEGLLMLSDGVGSFYGDLYGGYIGIVEAIFSFGSAVTSLEAFGVGAGPIGIGIALIALYLWVTIE